MLHKFKALGLALVAVLAMSAFVASVTQAKSTITITTSVSPVNIHATAEGIDEEFTIDGVTTVCAVSHYTGTVSTRSSTVAVKPSYTSCTFKGTSIPVTVTNHDCVYQFTGTASTGGGNYNSSVAIECVAKGITITSATCATTINTQNYMPNVSIKNVANDILLTPNVTGITGNVTADGFLCPLTSTGHKTGGKYVASNGITATATSATIQVSGS